MRWGSVVDFIDVGIGSHRFWTFNVADSAITVGHRVGRVLALGPHEQQHEHEREHERGRARRRGSARTGSPYRKCPPITPITPIPSTMPEGVSIA
jgi:hypothetical protein